MYGKIFESMYDGTIAVNWKGLITLQQMIVLCDSDGIIDMTPPALSRRTNIPLEIIEEGIAFLEKPDAYSRSPSEEGRRIVRLDESRIWGWRIVNHKYYRDLASREDKREKATNRQRRHRAKSPQVTEITKVSRTVTPSHACHAMQDADADANTTKGEASPHPRELVWQMGASMGIDRKLIGKLVKQYTAESVAEKLTVMAMRPPANPPAYLIGALRPHMDELGENYID